MKKLVILVLLSIVVTAGVIYWRSTRVEAPNTELVLYGNVDLREVALAFNNSERISEILVQEGDKVHKGQVMARLDTSRLMPLVNKAESDVEAQRHVVERLRKGSRPEEIAQAKANVGSAQADVAYEEYQFHRLDGLAKESSGRAVSKQDYDNTRYKLSSAKAKLTVNQKSLELAVLGPRVEDIQQAESQLKSLSAQRDLLHKQLADTELLAPVDAVVRNRIMEPGEMSSPQKPVFSLAITDPKWVRAYVSETDLGKVHPGMKASITVDSFPQLSFEGWVGFISPVAEFTPKSVETTELRPSLVYEIRVFVKDDKDKLRLGMPASVRLSLLDRGSPSASPTSH